MTVRLAATEGRFAVWLFGTMVGLVTAAALLATILSRLIPPPHAVIGTFLVPPAFAFSTLLLILCSVALQLAVNAVRRERQRKFRRSLAAALACGTGFVGVQSYGLWCIVQSLQADRTMAEAQLGAAALVLGAAALHAFHVSVALMALAFVTLRAWSDRYDHEYWFGVTVCAWIWHILGILWIFILGAYAIVSSFLTIRVPTP